MNGHQHLDFFKQGEEVLFLDTFLSYLVPRLYLMAILEDAG